MQSHRDVEPSLQASQPSQAPAPVGRFAAFQERTKARVDAALGEWLAPRVRRARALGDDVGAHAEAIFELSARGGKRLRPALAAVAYQAFGGAPERDDVTPALVALELLQTYLLIHDDWMDGDEIRRGGPSVHAALGARFGSTEKGAVAGILAGDLASAYALEALVQCRVPAGALVEAVRELAEMHHRVVLGQTLDVVGVGSGTVDVEQKHDLKTGSYTVRGPLRLGAALAGAEARARDALNGYAAPLGVAFQLRDDVLGLFGDPSATGKPRGGDLREGKATSIVAALGDDPTFSVRLARARSMDDAQLARLVSDLEAAGVRARVEARIEVLLKSALSSLGALPIDAPSRELFEGAALALVRRER